MLPARSALLALWVGSTALAAPSPVAIAGLPVAPVLPQPGVGLCSASSVSADPGSDFPQSPATFNAGVNAFLEANLAGRQSSVLRTVFDLSNNNSSGLARSYGDFVDSQVPKCASGGCDFFITDTTTSF